MEKFRKCGFLKATAIGTLIGCGVAAFRFIFMEFERRESAADKPGECLSADVQTDCSPREISFYGVEFGKSFAVPTNDLVQVKATFKQGTGKNSISGLLYFWSRRDIASCQSNLFDFAEVHYTYKTVTPEEVAFYAVFPKGMKRMECIAKLKEFESELQSRYGIGLKDVQDPPDYEEPADFVPGEAPKEVAGSQVRYIYKRGTQFYYRGFVKGILSGRILAAESLYGERFALLRVHDAMIGDKGLEGFVKSAAEDVGHSECVLQDCAFGFPAPNDDTTESPRGR